MSITNIRDRRDKLPQILRPGDNLYAMDETAFIVRETGIDGLRVWFNIPRRKFIIEDSTVAPEAAYVMVVQESDGSPRDIDMRTVMTLRKQFGRHKEAAEELIKGEIEHDRANKARRAEAAYGLADTLKWVGRAVTPSVGWTARSAAREAISKVKN